MKKKLFSILLSLAMVATMMPAMTMTAFAAGIDTWDALQNAINLAGNGTTISLTSDLTAENGDSEITIETGKSITLDLNGHILDAAQKCGVIYNKGTLTIKDNSAAKTGKITGGRADYGGGISSDGTLIVKDITITENEALYSGGGVCTAGEFTMDNASIKNCRAGVSYTEAPTAPYDDKGGAGGGVYLTVDSATFTMNGGTISECSSDGKVTGKGIGGAVCTRGTFTMNDGIIENCKSSRYGGAVESINNDDYTITAKFIMNAGTIRNCQSNYGGGVDIDYEAEFVMNNGSITNCTATEIIYDSSCAGGVYVEGDGAFTMKGGSITYCKALDSDGGGVYVDYGCHFNMYGGSIYYNNAGNLGGGIYVEEYDDPDPAGELVLGGSAKVFGNSIGSPPVINNVYLTDSTYLTIADGENAPASGMSAGITTATAPTAGTPIKFSNNGGSDEIKYFFSDKTNYYVANNANNYLELKAPAAGEHYIDCQSTDIFSAYRSKQYAVSGEAITLTFDVDPNWFITDISVFERPSNNPVASQKINDTTYTFFMPNSNVQVSAACSNVGPGPTPGPTPGPEGGGSTPVEEYTVPVESETTVQVAAVIDNGKAAVKEITENIIAEVTKPRKGQDKADSIIIDLSQAKQEVTAVELTAKTVENLKDAVISKDNDVEKITIKMTEATVELDAKTMKTVEKEAAGNTLTLVVDKTQEEKLNSEQKDTLSNYNVDRTFEAYFEANGRRIHDFKGGKATIGIKFEPEKGKNANNYKLYYIDENGKMHGYATKYEKGMLKFTTTHFSDFAIVYEGTHDILLLKAKTSGSNALKLSWNKVQDVEKYVLYGAKCGNSIKKLKSLTARNFTVKEIAGISLYPHNAYKFYVVGYDALGNKVKSKTIHFITATTVDSYANVSYIKAKSKKLGLGIGDSKKVGATYIVAYGRKHLGKNHGAALRYISNNPEVAKVNKTGKVTAVSAGTATIYIQDIGGKYCKTKVTVE